MLKASIVYLTICNNNHNNNNNKDLLQLLASSSPRFSEYEIYQVSSGCSRPLTASPLG